MTEDELLASCREDLKLNRADIAGEGIRIPQLLTKYAFLLMEEKRRLRSLEYALAEVKKKRFEFYRHGPSKESKTKWADIQKAPAGAVSKKAELEIHLEADPDYIAGAEAVAKQKDVIEIIEEMLTHIRQRQFILSNITKQTMFEAGV